KFRVVSKATDPGLTTFAKDVRGWICQPSPRMAALQRARLLAGRRMLAPGGRPTSDLPCGPQGPPWHITGGTILIEGAHGGPAPVRFQLPSVADPARFTLTLSGTLIPGGIKGKDPLGKDSLNYFLAVLSKEGKDGALKQESPGSQRVTLGPENNSKSVVFRM